MNEFLNFDKISRETWQDLYKSSLTPLTKEELESIRSLNDEISLKDVSDVYLPLVHLIRLYRRNLEEMSFTKGLFLRKIVENPPLIIGISGSVAVGKSTTARLLQLLLSRAFRHTKVELVTTDGFLYSNQTLENQGILDKKGFPESYDMEKLLKFLYKMKSGQDVEIPVYSHQIYDILANQTKKIVNPDILIIEGINVLQSPENQLLYISDFYDFSIYVDANEKVIEKWFRERFSSLLTLAESDAQNFYHQFTKMPKQELEQLISDTWNKVNLKNLREFIEPTRSRAELIIHKSENHYIDALYLKKY